MSVFFISRRRYNSETPHFRHGSEPEQAFNHRYFQSDRLFDGLDSCLFSEISVDISITDLLLLMIDDFLDCSANVD
jgi:hypothetical protein